MHPREKGFVKGRGSCLEGLAGQTEVVPIPLWITSDLCYRQDWQARRGGERPHFSHIPFQLLVEPIKENWTKNVYLAHSGWTKILPQKYKSETREAKSQVRAIVSINL